MRSNRGFSLIELMVALVVAGIVLSIGVPSWQGFRRTMRQREGSDQVMQAIRGARQTAVTTHRQVILVFGTAPTTTNITSYTQHVDNDGDRFKDTGEKFSSKAMPGGVRIASAALTPVDTLIFDTSGSLYPGTTGGTLVISGGRGQPDTLMVSSVGMVFRP